MATWQFLVFTKTSDLVPHSNPGRSRRSFAPGRTLPCGKILTKFGQLARVSAWQFSSGEAN